MSYKDLADRVCAASPEEFREIEALICEKLGAWSKRAFEQRNALRPRGSPPLDLIAYLKDGIAPRYLSDLNAAMSLAPKGQPFDIGCEDNEQSDWIADLTCFDSDPHSYRLYIRAPTPAQALTAAALLARAE